MRSPGAQSYPLAKWGLTFLFVNFFLFHGSGQVRPGDIQGKVRDSSGERGCSFVVVAVLNSDSSLVRFTRTRRDGSWMIRGIAPGNYLLMASHPAFEDKV